MTGWLRLHWLCRSTRQAPAKPARRALRCASSRLKRDLGHCPIRLRAFEILTLAKAKKPGNQVARKRLHQNVLIAYRPVIVAARHLQLRLQLAQLLLKIEKVRARLELRITLGKRDKLAQRNR